MNNICPYCRSRRVYDHYGYYICAICGHAWQRENIKKGKGVLIRVLNQKEVDEYEKIPVVLRLMKNISIVDRLIAEYKYNGSIDKFASEEIRQAILPIGRDYPVNVREYANRLVEKEKM